MYMKKFALAGACALVLAGCGNKNEQLEKFYKEVNVATEKEKPVEQASTDLNKLENEKVQLFNKINKADLKEIHKNAKLLLKNVDERSKVLETEKKAYDASAEAFDKAVPLSKEIKDKERSKEAEDIIKKGEERYASHDAIIKDYEVILKKEDKIYNYLLTERPEGKKVNDMIKDMDKSYTSVRKHLDDFSKLTKELEKEKKDVVNILNNK